MKRWIAPGVLALFVVGMLTYGVNFYHQEQLEHAKNLFVVKLQFIQTLPKQYNFTLLADRYEEEKR